jgi:S-adenosylmethionine/arginine decarboxylase-like enzyme
MAEVEHLKVLGVGDPKLLGDVEFVRKFIEDMVDRVGMQPLGSPVLHDVPIDIEKLGREPFEDEGGVTGQILGHVTLSTSHVFMFIGLHTWPVRAEFSMDVFSCRPYDRAEIEAFIADTLRVQKLQSRDLTFACKWATQQLE